jgi:predicted NAD/FAD-binding protein
MSSLTPSNRRKKVAIIGSGSAWIGALWALNRTHHNVYIYEAADRWGGHTNTVEFKNGKFKTLVDTGFIVLNTATCRKYHLRREQLHKLIVSSQLHQFLKGYQGTYGTD